MQLNPTIFSRIWCFIILLFVHLLRLKNNGKYFKVCLNNSRRHICAKNRKKWKRYPLIYYSSANQMESCPFCQRKLFGRVFKLINDNGFWRSMLVLLACPRGDTLFQRGNGAENNKRQPRRTARDTCVDAKVCYGLRWVAAALFFGPPAVSISYSYLHRPCRA